MPPIELNFSETTLPTLALWGIGFGAILVGFLIGYIDSNLRSAKLIEAAESKAEVVRAESERKLGEAEAIKAQAPKTMDDPGLLRLKNKDGMPSLEMDGMLLNPKNISADQKKRMIELLSVIRPWLEGGQPISAPPVATPKMTAVPPPPMPSNAPIQMPSASAPVLSSTQSLPLVKLSEKEFKALSIIGQIDYVFQSRIAGTPYEGIGIRIMEGAGGSVEVKIGSDKFPSIDDVPDAEIKKAIRAAIAEWEDKHIPGL